MTPVKVEIEATEDGYQLLRGGEPYLINGAGMGVDDLENFAAHGGNSIRTWSTNSDYQDTLALLDAAQANGVTVALCLSMQAERHGFDARLMAAERAPRTCFDPPQARIVIPRGAGQPLAVG